MKTAHILILFLTALLVGCASSSTSSKDPYTEIKKDGRIYLIGKAETVEAFKKTHHLPYTKTFIGQGPMGETVVVEVCKEDNEFANKIWKAYSDKNLSYFEMDHKGRTYVFGSPSSMQKFKQTHHMALTKTFIAQGAKGQTVVVEVCKENAGLADELWGKYQAKHKK